MDWDSVPSNPTPVPDVWDSIVSTNPVSQRVRRATPRKQANRKDTPFKERPFIAWDGEGDTARDEYILFGCSMGDCIQAETLTADDCFKFMIDTVEKYGPKKYIHIGFALNYDVTMICKHLPASFQLRLKTEKVACYGDYQIEYLRNKWFVVTDRARGITARIYDIFSFFACSAMNAWKEYLPDEPIYAQVSEGKENRNLFTWSDIDTIREYMLLELELYRKLAERLRLLLAELEVFPSSWHGPGAVAQAVLRKFKIKDHKDDNLPEEVTVASQYAYFGGRFEQFVTGRYNSDVYTADIRSAYPYALTFVPSLSGGTWEHRTYQTGETPSRCMDFALYHVRYRKSSTEESLYLPSPFPYRDEFHCVHYPNFVDGWYWGVEVNAALANPTGTIEFVEAWEFYPQDDTTPFAFIDELFRKRQKWKNEGNPVQLAAKLILNSMYGKLAQRVGWNQNNNTPPKMHQLEWAGFTTAYCRSMIYRAISQHPKDIIAVETDGIFSTTPFEFPPDTKSLGDWESDTYTGIIYVQSGFYWIQDQANEWSKARTRGFVRGTLPLSDCLNKIDTLEPIVREAHRFLGISGFAGKENIGTWVDTPISIEWGGGGKRFHNWELCPKCNGENTQLHSLIITWPHGGISNRHVLPWRDEVDNIKKMFWEMSTSEDHDIAAMQTPARMEATATPTN